MASGNSSPTPDAPRAWRARQCTVFAIGLAAGMAVPTSMIAEVVSQVGRYDRPSHSTTWIVLWGGSFDRLRLADGGPPKMYVEREHVPFRKGMPPPARVDTLASRGVAP